MDNLLRSYPQAFFSRPTLEVARDLLGAILCRQLPDGPILSGRIVEVEAYTANDPACHASRGLTERTSVMFGPPGHAYVYFIYGMYHCLNVVTEPEGTPAAVLIRAVDAHGAGGPGKLCREWGIDRSLNGAGLMVPGSALWLCPAEPVPDRLVATSPRIGITQAADWPWRFFLRDHPAVSAPNNGNGQGTGQGKGPGKRTGKDQGQGPKVKATSRRAGLTQSRR